MSSSESPSLVPMLSDCTRREFAVVLAGGLTALVPADAQTGQVPAGFVPCRLRINGQVHDLVLDPRVTLLDLVRETLSLTGSKKGCDHGQCGACTVLIDGKRKNACLSLALSQEGRDIVTIEGLAKGDQLHPVQAAFIEHDGFQCGYCTPGQICSAVALLEEVKAGMPSAATKDVRRMQPVQLTDEEIRERMSGNLCRCGAYPNIVAAVRALAGKEQA